MNEGVSLQSISDKAERDVLLNPYEAEVIRLLKKIAGE